MDGELSDRLEADFHLRKGTRELGSSPGKARAPATTEGLEFFTGEPDSTLSEATARLAEERSA